MNWYVEFQKELLNEALRILKRNSQIQDEKCYLDIAEHVEDLNMKISLWRGYWFLKSLGF